MRASWDGDPVSGFDEDFAAGFVGKVVLVGVTELALDGALASQEQLHGVIVAATAHGIDIALRGVHEGTTWRMPPWLDELVIARPGASRGSVIRRKRWTPLAPSVAAAFSKEGSMPER